MTTAEISAQYCVPMPETCKELDWQKETNFVWFFDSLCLVVPCLDLIMQAEKKAYPTFFLVNVENGHIFNKYNHYTFAEIKEKCLPAPQFHEIGKELPPFSNCSYQTIYQKTMKKELIYSKNVEERICILVENGNIAQAAAELYLKLKSQNHFTKTRHSKMAKIRKKVPNEILSFGDLPNVFIRKYPKKGVEIRFKLAFEITEEEDDEGDDVEIETYSYTYQKKNEPMQHYFVFRKVAEFCIEIKKLLQIWDDSNVGFIYFLENKEVEVTCAEMLQMLKSYHVN